MAGTSVLALFLVAWAGTTTYAGEIQPLSSSTHIDHIVATVSERYGIDHLLVHAVIRAESRYDIYAVSAKGAQGLMQLMPDTQRELGVRNPYDPWENVDGGVRYLLRQLLAFGQLDQALGAYNAGPRREKSRARPAETIQYIRKVQAEYLSLSSQNR